MPESVYIHIPFCKSKCKYCSFISFNRMDLKEQYIEALLKEISVRYAGEPLKTLYLGGGTPSLLSKALMSKVVKSFNYKPDAEITLELNPDDADCIKDLKECGINRLSIGSQTFDDNILKIIGRRHSSDDIAKAVSAAKSAGFNNISLDLIYGLPLQTKEGLMQDLGKFLKLDIQHISTYGLKIENESFWGRNPAAIPSGIPDEDCQADMYELINEYLENEGFYRYEISNFARHGFESRHNLNYWDNGEYYGFGVAAHGYINGIRYSNTVDIDEYIKNPVLPVYKHQLSKTEKLEEEIILGFRKKAGINIKKIKKQFGLDFETKYKNILKKYSDYIEKTNEGYTLNIHGVLISNIILSEFLES